MRPGRRVHQRRQRIHIGAFELGQLPVFENLAHDLVFRGQGFEDIDRRRNRLALAVPHRRGQTHLLEQNFAQLLRRGDVELAARQSMNLAREPRDARLPCRFESRVSSLVSIRIPAMFHARQNTGQRQFDFVIELAESLAFDFRAAGAH